MKSLKNSVFIGTVVGEGGDAGAGTPSDFPRRTCGQSEGTSPCRSGSGHNFVLGEKRVDWNGPYEYLVHIPELMPGMNPCEGVWCDNGIIYYEYERCDSMGGLNAIEDHLANFYSIYVAPTGIINAATGPALDAAIKTIFGVSNNYIYHFMYTKIPINIKVFVLFLENDINSGVIQGFVPYNPRKAPKQFIDG